MKKSVCSIICLVSITLCACGKQGKPVSLPAGNEVISIGVSDGEKYAMSEMLDSADNTPETVSFRAAVTEASDSSILVKPADGSPELDSADAFRIPNKEHLALQAGDLVEITYNGDILESYPAQLGEVYEIVVVRED